MSKKDTSRTFQVAILLISRGIYMYHTKGSNHSSARKLGMSIVFMFYILRAKRTNSFKIIFFKVVVLRPFENPY